MSETTHPADTLEAQQVAELRCAQDKAACLFHEIETRGLIRAGIPESQPNQEICDLGQSDLPMRSTDAKSRMRHWILEIHFGDRARKIGGYFEELLTAG